VGKSGVLARDEKSNENRVFGTFKKAFTDESECNDIERAMKSLQNVIPEVNQQD